MVVKNSKSIFDITIIGGGILGVMCAYYAQKKWPTKKIAIIEKRLLGNGVTAYSACLDVPFATTPFKKKLTLLSQELYKQLLIEIPEIAIGITPLIGVTYKGTFPEIKSSLFSKGSKYVKKKSIEKLTKEKFNLPEEATFFNGSKGRYFKVNIAKVIGAKLLYENKVAIFEGTKIVGVKGESDSYNLLTNYGVQFKSEVIIDASGPWITKGISSGYLANINLRSKKIIALHIDKIPEKNAPIIYYFNEDVFFCPQHHHARWLFSYRCNDWDVDIENENVNISDQNLNIALSTMNRFNPEMGKLVKGGRVYFDLYSETGDPVIKKVSKNYIIIAGPSGSGIRLAPGIASHALEYL